MQVEATSADQTVQVPVPTEEVNQQTTGDAQAETQPEVPKVDAPVETKKEEPLPDVIETTTDEKLQSARLELSFLKTQQEIERLKQVAANIQRGYPQFVDNLANKYKVDKTQYSFDAVEGNFKRKK